MLDIVAPRHTRHVLWRNACTDKTWHRASIHYLGQRRPRKGRSAWTTRCTQHAGALLTFGLIGTWAKPCTFFRISGLVVGLDCFKNLCVRDMCIPSSSGSTAPAAPYFRSHPRKYGLRAHFRPAETRAPHRHPCRQRPWHTTAYRSS